MRESKKLFDELVGKISTIYDLNEAKSILFMVFEQFLGFSKTDILSNKSLLQGYDFEPIVTRLLAHEPVQYIIGNAHFFDHKFLVKKGVTLIPRPETEELVLLAINYLKEKTIGNETFSVLDIGTGTGCIAISIANAIKNATVTAFDIDPEALEIAQLNNRLLKTNVNFQLQDALNLTKTTIQEFDLIISNPPYVTIAEKAQMNRNVLDYEPIIALFVDDNRPLLFYEKIGEYAINSLKLDGLLLFEINEQFGAETCLALTKIGFRNCQIIKDLNNKNRIVLAIK